jgi:glycosyltransferase involved in cell wall biosynthesis
VYSLADRGDSEENRVALRSGAPSWLRTTAYDLVWFNQERVWLSGRDLARGALVVDVDDLYDVVLRRWLDIGLTEHGRLAGPTDSARMLDAVQRHEAQHALIACEVDVMVFSSTVDRDRYPFDGAQVVPNVYERATRGPSTAGHRGADGGLRIVYPGYLEWPTNEDAAVQLAAHVAPRIRRSVPGLTVHLIGSASPRVQALGRLPGITVVGEVPDITSYLAAGDVLVAPIRVGSGTRIKILEAFAHRLPVVTTPVGAEGLDIVDGVHALVAEPVDALADACMRLLGDPELAAGLVARGAAFQEEHHRQQHADAAVCAAVETALRRAATRARSR